MDLLNDLWKLSIGGAFVAVSVLAYVFYKEEGRFRVYLSAFLIVVALEIGVSFMTVMFALPPLGGGSEWFFIPRTIMRTLEAVTAVGVILFMLGKLNGKRPQ